MRLIGRELNGKSLHTSLLLDAAAATAGEVPKGYFAVYVGVEARRFVLPTSFLHRPAFWELMKHAAEEFGFNHAGGISIPYREEDFWATVVAVEIRRQWREAAAR